MVLPDNKAPLDYDMVLVRSNNNPTATDILERLDRANGKTVRYAMGQMMYNNKKEGNIRYRVKDLVYDLETMQYLKDPRINKQAAAREDGAVTGSLAAADPEMMEVDIEELEGPPRRPIFGFHNPNNYCHGIASLVAVRHALYCLGLCAEQEQLMPASCSDLKTGLRCIQHVLHRVHTR